MTAKRLLDLVVPGSVLLIPLVLSFVPTKSYAIPPFSRQYGTSCTTCHLDFPKLNDFGKAFKDAGFKFPKDDADFLKVAPTMLGAEAQKQVFPKSVWPGTIPGMPPIGLRMNTFFQYTGGSRNQYYPLAAPGSMPQYIPATDFQTGLFSLFSAGNFGSDIAFWVDDDISVGGNNSNGGLGDAYLKFVNVSRFMKMPTDSLSVKVGQFELDLPVTQARNWNLSPYDIYTEANIGAMSSILSQSQNVNNQFTMADAAKGVEISGGHTYGGYHYSVAVFDQNTSGLDQTGSVYVPSATGGANGGVGFASDSSFKNVYARFFYRFNLERDKASRDSIQAAGATGPRDHTYLSLGGFYLDGKSQQRFCRRHVHRNQHSALCARTLLPRRRRFQLQLPDVQCFRPVHVWQGQQPAAGGRSGLANSTAGGFYERRPGWIYHQLSGHVQRRLSRGGLPGSTVVNVDPALGRSELHRGPHQWADVVGEHPVLRPHPFNAQPLHDGRSVSDSPQH